MDQGDKENQKTTLNKYAFGCAIVASMISIVSGYGNIIAFSNLSNFKLKLNSRQKENRLN